MTIKHLSLLLLSSAALAFAACQERIDDRYKLVESSGPARTIIIEEYTGMDCKNCPNGHALLSQIESRYNTPENRNNGIGVIAIGIHIPAFGFPVDLGGLVTPEADKLAPEQNTAPEARINRHTGALATDQWLREVEKEISRPTALQFTEPVTAVVANGVISISGIAKSTVEIADAKLHAWIVEDNIIAEQLKENGEYDPDYSHHAVYRASLTGINGQDITLVRNTDTPFEAGPFPVHSAWNPANLRVVVFITGADGPVINATESHLQIQ